MPFQYCDLLLAAPERAALQAVLGRAGCPQRAAQTLKIAERGPMPLFMADIHLSRARLFGTRNTERGLRNEEAKYPWESPEHELAEARRLIEKHGYGRRKEEWEDAEQALGVRG